MRMEARAAMRFGAMVLALGAPLYAGCGGDDASSGSGGSAGSSGAAGAGGTACVIDTSYDPQIDAANFVDAVDNPLYPLAPGTTWTYVAGEETIHIEVLAEKKMLLGVSCTAVHDVASVAGETIEDTFDWYAQDKDGAVWYFGEDTKELSGGQVTSTHGSWTAGVDAAKPGFIVPSNPKVGDDFRQEYYACEAEDRGTVLALDATATTPLGSYSGCLKTHDYSPLEPALNEEKYYCPDTGIVLIVDTKTQDREELTELTKP